mmetsp:Transcript_83752/g.162851  ORF Transcript_83752/g.162851 Transcript_83752/m.162851 type:complete len:274 (-) Transcript_83752:1340-2161(-)
MVPHHRRGVPTGILTESNPPPGEKATAFLASFPSAIYQPLLGVYRDPEPFPCCNSSPRSTAAVSTPVAAGSGAAPLAPARGSAAIPMPPLGWVSHQAPWPSLFEPQFDCREEGTADDDGCCCCYHRRCFQAQAKLPCTSTCRRTPRDSGTRTLVLPLFRPRCGLLGALRIRYRAPRSAVVVGVAAVGRREDTGEGDSNGSRQRGRRRLSPCQQQSWLLLLLDPSSSRRRPRFLHPHHNQPFSGYYFHFAVPRPLLSLLRLGRKGCADDDDGFD